MVNIFLVPKSILGIIVNLWCIMFQRMIVHLFFVQVLLIIRNIISSVLCFGQVLIIIENLAQSIFRNKTFSCVIMSSVTETITVTNDRFYGCFGTKPAELKIDYDYFFSPSCKSRVHNYLRVMGDKVFNVQGRAFKFSNGNPNPQCFPYEEFLVKLKTGDLFQLKDEQLADSLSYLSCNGYQPLLDLLKNYQDRFHGSQDWKKKDLTTTSGSQGGLHQLLEMCVAPGDPVLVQSPLYTGVISVLQPLNVEFIEVDSGLNGICTQRLENVLRERQKRNLQMPKIFYLNPTGSNPTGEMISTETKKEIYKIACDYNILIVEDDPYYLVTFDSHLPKSFLSLDIENRVVRFDSVSKVIGAGFRTGYVTGPKKVIDKLNLMKESSNYCPPFCQVIIYETLKSMGFDGLMKHADFLRSFYHRQCKTVIKCLNKYLKDVAIWDTPGAAMFVWLTIKNVDHISDDFIDKCLKNLVFIVPGFAFYGNDRLSPCIRLAFSMIEEHEIEEGIEILSRLIKEEISDQVNNKPKSSIMPK